MLGDRHSSRILDSDHGDWRNQAACANHDPELFFMDRHGTGRPPSSGERSRVTAAKNICRRCPVAAECLAWAYRTGDDWAVLGGTTPEERRLIRRAGSSQPDPLRGALV